MAGLAFPRFPQVDERVTCQWVAEGVAQKMVLESLPADQFDEALMREVRALVINSKGKIPPVFRVPKEIKVLAFTAPPYRFRFSAGHESATFSSGIFYGGFDQVKTALLDSSQLPIRWKVSIVEGEVTACLHSFIRDGADAQEVQALLSFLQRYAAFEPRVVLGQLSEPIRPYITQEMNEVWLKMREFTTRKPDHLQTKFGFASSVKGAHDQMRALLDK